MLLYAGSANTAPLPASRRSRAEANRTDLVFRILIMMRPWNLTILGNADYVCVVVMRCIGVVLNQSYNLRQTNRSIATIEL